MYEKDIDKIGYYSLIHNIRHYDPLLGDSLDLAEEELEKLTVSAGSKFRVDVKVDKYDTFGIVIKPAYWDSCWAPGARNTADAIVQDIEKVLKLVENAANAFSDIISEGFEEVEL